MGVFQTCFGAKSLLFFFWLESTKRSRGQGQMSSFTRIFWCSATTELVPGLGLGSFFKTSTPASAPQRRYLQDSKLIRKVSPRPNSVGQTARMFLLWDLTVYTYMYPPDPDPDPDIRWVWIRRILMHLMYLVHKMIQLMQNWFVDIAGYKNSAPLS